MLSFCPSKVPLEFCSELLHQRLRIVSGSQSLPSLQMHQPYPHTSHREQVRCEARQMLFSNNKYIISVKDKNQLVKYKRPTQQMQ